MPFRIALIALALATSAAAQTPADTLEFSDVTPEIIGGLAGLQSSITYPAADRAAGRQGMVVVRFVVTAEGKAADVRIARSVSPGLDAATIEAVLRTRFRPGTQNGQPVNVRITLPVRFTIRDDAPAPDQSSLDSDALLNGLGQPWPIAGLSAPDSLATYDGARTLAMWRAPRAGVEQVDAAVTRDTLRLVSIRFSPEAEPLLRTLARQIADARAPGQSDGFALASDLAANGLPATADMNVDPARLLMVYRQPVCRRIPGVGCVSDFPTVVGGMEELQRGVQYPHAARNARVSGTVLVALVVQADGTVTNVRVASNSATRGAGADALADEAVRAVRAARFLPAVRGGMPVAAASIVPIRFTVR